MGIISGYVGERATRSEVKPMCDETSKDRGLSDIVLRAERLTKRFDAVVAVDAVSFEVERGETLSLLGPSGCGKTTTLRLVAGLERPDEGHLTVADRQIASPDIGLFVPPENRAMGLVFQSYAVWPHMSVFENVAYPLRARRTPKREIKQRVQDMLEITGLQHLGDRQVTKLSGGQQQRVALARSLVYRPEILLLDEPLSNLDAHLRTEMRTQLKRLQAELNTTMLFVTHDQVEALYLSDRIAVMRDARIEQIGTPQEIYNHPATFFVNTFVGRNLTFPARISVSADGLVAEVGDRGRLNVSSMSSHSWRDGDLATIVIRPEQVSVHSGQAHPGLNQLVVEVFDVAYMGDRSELVLDLEGSQLIVRVPVDVDLIAGDTALLQMEPHSALAWPQNEGVEDQAIEREQSDPLTASTF